MAITYIRNHLWFLLFVSFCGFMYLKQRMSCLDKKFLYSTMKLVLIPRSVRARYMEANDSRAHK